MKINTKLFGEIEAEEEKLLIFEMGIIGFGEYKKYMLIHETDREEKNILWLQSIDEPELALPVIDPLVLVEDYNPSVEDELIKPLGEMAQEDALVFVTLTVPSDITKMTVNLKAPLIINAKTRKACQIIVDEESYMIKYPVYDILASKEKKEGED